MTYSAWEFRPTRMQMLPPGRLVCIARQIYLPKRSAFTYIGYHRSLAEFLKSDIGSGIVYSYIFIPTSSRKEADSIISDIKKQHPELRAGKRT